MERYQQGIVMFHERNHVVENDAWKVLKKENRTSSALRDIRHNAS